MPNYCSNSLTATDPGFVARVVLLHEDKNFDLFGAFVPIPGPLRSINAGRARADDGSIVTLWREVGETLVAVTADEVAANLALYGATDWYDWSIKHWGTKWPGSGMTLDFVSDESLVAHFDTAWAPPVPWLAEVASQYPKGGFTLAYAEGGMGFWGTMRFADGAVVSEEEFNEGFWSDEVDADGCPIPSPEVRAHLDLYGLHSGG